MVKFIETTFKIDTTPLYSASGDFMPVYYTIKKEIAMETSLNCPYLGISRQLGEIRISGQLNYSTNLRLDCDFLSLRKQIKEILKKYNLEQKVAG